MNALMIKRLIAKDWSLWKHYIALYTLCTVACLLLACVPNSKIFYAAAIFMITIVIGSGVHVIFELVLDERVKKSQNFIMSLPISSVDYTVAKSAAVTSIFCMIWGLIVTGSTILILALPTIPDGMLVFVLLVLINLLAGFSLILTTAIWTGAMSWTIIVMVANNIFVNFFIPLVAGLPGMTATMESDRVHFSPEAWMIAGCQILFTLCLFAANSWLPLLKKIET